MMKKAYEDLRLENQLCFPLYLCAKEMTRLYVPLLKQYDLTYTPYVVMMCLWERDDINVGLLCRILLLDTNTMTPLLQKLEQKGYIERRKCADDGRELKIYLTEKGSELRDLACGVPACVSERVGFTAEESGTLYRLLYKLLDNIKEG